MNDIRKKLEDNFDIFAFQTGYDLVLYKIPKLENNNTREFLKFTNLHNEVYINKNSEYVKKFVFKDTSNESNTRTLYTTSNLMGLKFGEIYLDSTKILDLMVFPYTDPEYSFKFESLDLKEDVKEQIYFTIVKLIKKFENIIKNINSYICGRYISDILERCKEKLPDELCLLLELES